MRRRRQTLGMKVYRVVMASMTPDPEAPLGRALLVKASNADMAKRAAAALMSKGWIAMSARAVRGQE